MSGARGSKILIITRSQKVAEEMQVKHSYALSSLSPYKRTLQTLRGIGRAFEHSRIARVKEELRVREQDFGGFCFSCPFLLLL